MNAIYRFATASRREPLTEPQRTLGIEITDPQIADQCGLGNIDPQHGQHRPPTMLGRTDSIAAIDYAYHARWAPPAGSTLATTRPDVDSVGAMAVLVLRAVGLIAPEAYASRDDLRNQNAQIVSEEAHERLERMVRLIAERDTFRPARGSARPPLPTREQLWPPPDATVSVDSVESLKGVGVICSPAPGQKQHPLAVRVAVMACWLLWGDDVGAWERNEPTVARIFEGCGVEHEFGHDGLDSWGAWAAVLYLDAAETAQAARRDLAEALDDGRMTVKVRDGIAIVRGLHSGALSIGYSQADIVVAEQRDPRLPAHDGTDEWPEQPRRKLTVAWREAGLVDRDALCAALNEAEVEYRASHGVALARVPRPNDAEDSRAAVREAVGAGWGGPAALLGSPPGGSVLPLENVVETIARHRVCETCRHTAERCNAEGLKRDPGTWHPFGVLMVP